jgi:hypothetical protein
MSKTLTAVVYIVTLVAVVALIVLRQPVPGCLVALLGGGLTSLFPGLLDPKVEAVTAELTRLEPIAVSLVEHLEQNPAVAARLRAVLGVPPPALLAALQSGLKIAEMAIPKAVADVIPPTQRAT